MAFECINLELVDGGVAILELNRPQHLNAFNRQMVGEWREALMQIADDRRIRAVVLTGAGRAFCAGGDADEMTEMQGATNVERKEYLWRSIQTDSHKYQWNRSSRRLSMETGKSRPSSRYWVSKLTLAPASESCVAPT